MEYDEGEEYSSSSYGDEEDEENEEDTLNDG